MFSNLTSKSLINHETKTWNKHHIHFRSLINPIRNKHNFPSIPVNINFKNTFNSFNKIPPTVFKTQSLITNRQILFKTLPIKKYINFTAKRAYTKVSNSDQTTTNKAPTSTDYDTMSETETQLTTKDILTTQHLIMYLSCGTGIAVFSTLYSSLDLIIEHYECYNTGFLIIIPHGIAIISILDYIYRILEGNCDIKKFWIEFSLAILVFMVLVFWILTKEKRKNFIKNCVSKLPK